MALGFVGRLGFGGDHPAVKAAFAGDFSLIKAELSSKGSKAQGWEQYIALAEKAYAEDVASKEATAKETRGIMHDVFGGEAQTEAILKWARENADPGERATLNGMINQGGIAARAASLFLAAAHGKATGTTKTPASPVREQPITRPSNGQALSPAEFQAHVAKLAAVNPNFHVTPEYADLVNRRRAFRG